MYTMEKHLSLTIPISTDLLQPHAFQVVNVYSEARYRNIHINRCQLTALSQYTKSKILENLTFCKFCLDMLELNNIFVCRYAENVWQIFLRKKQVRYM